MIPKIIHYCWYGKNEIPIEQQKLINHWKELMPDYKFYFWNDENLEELKDSFNNLAITNAYNDKKFAFLPDIIRFYVLKKYGGIYLDTDVKVNKKFDDLLNSKMFIGYIFNCLLGTAIIGSEANHPFVDKAYEKCVNLINHRSYIVSNNWFTQLLLDSYSDFLLTDKNTRLNNIDIYSRHYFEKISKDTMSGYSQHLCAGAWRNAKKGIIKKVTFKIIGPFNYEKISHLYNLRKNPFYKKHKHDLKTYKRRKNRE